MLTFFSNKLYIGFPLYYNGFNGLRMGLQFYHMTLEENYEKVDHTDKNLDLMVTYLMSSNFYQYLRHHYHHFLKLQEDQKNALVRNCEIFRVKEDHATVVMNFSQHTLAVLVYGELSTNNKIYAKGSYLTLEPGKKEVHFLKKTAIMMLNNQEIHQLMDQYQAFYTQKDIMDKTLPTEILGLDRRKYKLLCSQAHWISNTTNPPYSMAFQGQPGIYLLYQGIYSLLNSKGIKITELTVDYVGDQCLWGDVPKYHIRPQTYKHKYIWLSKQLLLEVLTPQAVAKMRQFHSKRQRIRSQIQRKCTQSLELANTYIKGKSKTSIKKKYSPQQIEQFQRILEEMSKKRYKPKWKQEEEKLKAQKIQKMKQKRIYMPKKAKSKYFSTLTDRQTSPDYHHTFYKTDSNPFYLKLHLQDRAPTQVLSHRRSRTEATKRSIEPQEILRRKTSHGFYSNNYDRSYSKGMENLSKMQRYDQMKKKIILQKGQKVMSTDQMAQSLSKSFGELYSTLSCKNRKHRMDPDELFRQTMKKTHLLAKKIMQSRGAATWR